MDKQDSIRILYVYPGPVPPPSDLRRDKMYYIPEPICGDILCPTWDKDEQQVRQTLGPDSYPEHKVNNFTYHIHPTGLIPLGSARQKLDVFLFFLRHGLRLIRKNKYDCIMTYGWTLTGVAAWILKVASGAPLIVEIGTAPHQYNRYGRFGVSKQTIGMRLGRGISDLLLNLIGGSAVRLQLRYPKQLDHYSRLHKKPASVIHGFVPVSQVPYTGRTEKYVLLVGAPWYLKGADVLIRAFQMVQPEFPDFHLRLLGYFPDPEPLEALAAGNPNIEILKPLPNAEVLQVIADCSVFVLASRTEAGGRVLLEAMAAGKPLLASDVDGNPVYVNDGVNGFLFESENAKDLADKLRKLLASPELRKDLGDTGYHLTRTKYSEASFGEQFRTMAALAVGRPDLAAPRASVASDGAVKPPAARCGT
jgi:glycosyltransferase involved in cell wall biosynthesis